MGILNNLLFCLQCSIELNKLPHLNLTLCDYKNLFIRVCWVSSDFSSYNL
ncbi:MAG: hypothetical protein BAJALOKI1v1_110031 [Promethearchaeota archaeon]|nr:MAG: hypothetical protein BAJALOKI1v1_110031 [Candidatus Lokiarchaeota archaeon]